MKKTLFNEIDREVIRWYYKTSKTKGKFWAWWNKPIVVTQYEVAKAKRDFDKAIKETKLYKWLKNANHYPNSRHNVR